MQCTPILIPAGVLLILLLVSEARGSVKGKLASKTPLSLLFVITALLQPHPVPGYFHLVFAGLVLGMIGDVCLAIPGDKSFRVGLFAFLGGHMIYVVAFGGLSAPGQWLSPGLIVVLGLSLGAFLWLRPHIGRMRGPVMAYLVVISLMLMAAWAAFANPALAPTGARFLFVGALLFYLSDICVARQRFVTEQFVNRLIGLPLYYTGQYLIAFSVGLLA